MQVKDLLEALKGIDPSTPLVVSGLKCEEYAIEGVYYDGHGAVSIDITTNEGESNADY
jgi:hypothetical protein